MTMITLPPEIEQTVAERAKQQGTTSELLVLDSLHRLFPTVEEIPEEQPEAVEGATLYDFLKDHIGTIHSSERIPGGAQMAADSGKQFAEGIARKQQGHCIQFCGRLCVFRWSKLLR